jgi:hypothetical protein
MCTASLLLGVLPAVFTFELCQVGYSLNALVDFPPDDPIAILKHLLVGSEGTLGFISNVTYNTVPEVHHKVRPVHVFAVRMLQLGLRLLPPAHLQLCMSLAQKLPNGGSCSCQQQRDIQHSARGAPQGTAYQGMLQFNSRLWLPAKSLVV